LLAGWQRVAGALVLGAVGGSVCAWLELPLAWMIGALVATMAGSLAGARIRIPNRLREPMVAVLGVMLGSSFQPELLADAVRWLPSLLLLPVCCVLLGVATYLYLRRVAGLDRITAYFAAMPGGLSEMIIVGDRMGGDMRVISLVHATRVALIVLTVPFLSRKLDDTAVATAAPALPVTPLELIALLVLAALGYLLARLVRLPAPALIGAMITSAAAYLGGLIDGSPPWPLVAAAQLVLGASVGSRFSGTPMRVIGRMLLIGLGVAVLMLAITLLFALALVALTSIPLLELLLALIPGGLAEMSLTALALGIEPAFVATHHIWRIAVVMLVAPSSFLLLRRMGAMPSEAEPRTLG
jgi:uncharacterized protein